MDIALCIEKIVPNASYMGAFEKNEKEEFDVIDWLDNRDQPTWEMLLNVSAQVELEISASKQIENLENDVSQRRIREVILTDDKTFIENVEGEISTLRASL